MLVLDTTHDVAPTDDLATLVVDDDQRRRSRFRSTTEDGRAVGVVRGGDSPLRTGDVLGTAAEPIAVVELQPREAAVVDLAGVGSTTDHLLAMAERGHALGNRHRELAVRGTELLVPVTDGRDRLRDDLEPLPDGATLAFEDVDPGLFDDADAGHGDHTHDEHAHGHAHESDHSHDHGEGGHSHDHGEGGHSHDHGEGGHSHDHGEGGHSHDHGEGGHSHDHGGGGARTVDVSDGGGES